MMKIINEAEDRSSEYDEYLRAHIQGVKDSWYQILRPNIDEVDGINFKVIDEVINRHDESKYGDEEYIPYLNHFYPTEDHPNDEVAFDLAWLHHQHHNPHHWQHWLLQKDSGKLVTMDMPWEYVCEMLCDWNSFSRKDPKSTAYAWWEKNKDKMVMSKVTKERVNYLIKIFKDNPLNSEE